MVRPPPTAPGPKARVYLAALCLFWIGFSGPSIASARESSNTVIVKMRAFGADIQPECEEAAWKTRRADPSARGGPHSRLDIFHSRYRTRSVKALFRDPGRRSMAAQLERLRRRGERLDRIRSRRRAAVASGPHSTAEPVAEQMMELAHIYEIELPADVDLPAAIGALQDSPGVEYVQAKHVQRLDQSMDDPFLYSEGSWGQPYPDLWGLHRISAPDAWQTSQGEETIIAVVDTGLDTAHPDIADNVWVNPGEDLDANGRVDAADWNGVDDDGNGFIDDLMGWNFVGYGLPGENEQIFVGSPDVFDDVGHGTHVSGTAAAVGNNGIGIAGVAPRSRVMPLKAFPAEGSARDTDVWSAVLYAIENGADVINASFSCNPHCPENPMAREVLAIAEAAGVVFVTSAGNSSLDVVVNDPENSRAAITVGSIGFDDELSDFSNRGWLLDLVAPGGGPSRTPGVFVVRRNILSLLSTGTDPVELPFAVAGDLYRLAGTSMAAPAVAGAVALLRSHRPELTPVDVRRLLRLASEDLGEVGHDPVYGGGLLDLPALLAEPLPDLDLVFEAPVPNQVFDPEAAEIPLRIRAAGGDLDAYTVEFAKGLVGGPFVEIERGRGSLEAETIQASWDARALPDGAYSLRLRGTLRSGAVVDEYTIVSLERNAFVRLSQSRAHERAPHVDGDSVVWVAERSEDTAIELGGFDRWGEGRTPRSVYQSELRLQRPMLSAGDLAWLEIDPETSMERLLSCQLGRSHRSFGRGNVERGCRAVLQAEAESRLSPFRLAEGRLLWSPRLGGLLDLLICRLRGAKACDATRLPGAEPAANSVRLLDFDGRTAVYVTGPTLSRIELCSIHPGHVGCEPVHVPIPPTLLPIDAAAIDGRLLVLQSFGFNRPRLFHCDVDLDTGACDPRPVADGDSAVEVAVSGRRIVWTRNHPTGLSSIEFCEIDPVDEECRAQVVTGGIVPSRTPDIDGPRLVWADERFGPSQILSAELPVLWAPASISLRRGARQIGYVYGRDPSRKPLSLELEGVDGIRPEDVGARFERGFGNLVRLVTDTGHDVSGTGLWRLIGRGAGGWITQRTIEVEISKRRRHSVPWRLRGAGERRGRELPRTF